VWFLAWCVLSSWLFWVPAALVDRAVAPGLVTVLHYIGGAMPGVAAIVLVAFREGASARRSFLRRALDPRPLLGVWGAVALLMAPLFVILGGLFDGLLGGPGLQLEQGAPTGGSLSSMAVFALFALIFGPLPEELAWRGYALDRLATRGNLLISNMVIYVVWSLWHVPLFFIEGTFQQALGFGTVRFWLFVLEMLPASLVMGWLWLCTGRSILSAVMFHFSVNLTGQIFASSLRAEIAYAALLFAMALVMAKELATRGAAGRCEGEGAVI